MIARCDYFANAGRYCARSPLLALACHARGVSGTDPAVADPTVAPAAATRLQLSNRNIPLLETIPSHCKQTTGPRSTR